MQQRPTNSLVWEARHKYVPASDVLGHRHCSHEGKPPFCHIFIVYLTDWIGTWAVVFVPDKNLVGTFHRTYPTIRRLMVSGGTALCGEGPEHTEGRCASGCREGRWGKTRRFNAGINEVWRRLFAARRQGKACSTRLLGL